MDDDVFSNATLVLPDGVCAGTLVQRNGRIVACHAVPLAHGTDLEGDYLLPGLIDLHTDNLERQVLPRQGARWPSRSAFLAHDAQCAAAGITTVFDALCAGNLGFDEPRAVTCREGIADLDALAGTGLLKAEHYLHLRCEMPADDLLAMLDAAVAHPRLRLVSLMDHVPGHGQYGDLARYRDMQRRDGMSDAAIDRQVAALQAQRGALRTPNRRAILDRVRAHAAPGIVLASHDDRTLADIEENEADGVRISEFPTTMEAARAAKQRGMQVIAGAPNLVRGGSHAGNVGALELLLAGAVDAYASDYVPASLLEAAFLSARLGNMELADAVRMVTATPAAMAGLSDRGALVPGLRADLVRVRLHDGQPVVRGVWRAGRRVA